MPQTNMSVMHTMLYGCLLCLIMMPQDGVGEPAAAGWQPSPAENLFSMLARGLSGVMVRHHQGCLPLHACNSGSWRAGCAGGRRQRRHGWRRSKRHSLTGAA